MTHKGYFRSLLNGREYVYRCCECPYDSFLEENAAYHVKSSHGPAIRLPDTSEPIDSWVRHRLPPEYAAARLGTGILSWNDGVDFLAAMSAIILECGVLAKIGLKVDVFWFDNGSTDGSANQVACRFPTPESAWEKSGIHFSLYRNLASENLGVSHARNWILDQARFHGCDSLILIDGDVEMIPNSAYGLWSCLRTLGDPSIACIGMHSHNCAPDQSSPDCRWIPPSNLKSEPRIAWTQYGIFSMSALVDVRFEESGPFAGPGWGLEDDDLWLQLALRGFKCLNTNLFTYRHKRHGSIKRLGADLVTKCFTARRDFLLAKYLDIPDPPVQVDRKLRLLANASLPVLG